MANPLELAIRSGIRANEDVGKLFARVGTKEHPRGFVLSAYRNARRAMRSALAEPYPVAAAAEVIAELRRTVRSEALTLLTDAEMQGTDEAARQLRFYGIETTRRTTVSTLALASADALLARIDAQGAAIQALILTGADEGQIIGDEERAGVLRASDVAVWAAQLAASLGWGAFESWSSQHASGYTWKKQAVAALDNRTTDCCLRVHGQVQPFTRPFELTGTPRYADRMDWPGFHPWCRTAGVLYSDDFDFGLTGRLTEAAQTILNERADGVFRDRNPADAFG